MFEKLLTDSSYRDVCKNICGNRTDLVDDLFQHVVLILLELKQEQKDKIQDVRWYFVRLCMNEFRGTRSRFNNQYKHNEEVLLFEATEQADESNYNEDIDKMEAAYRDTLPLLHWYDRELWLLYQREQSIRKISSKTKIPIASIQLSLTKVKDHVRTNYKILTTGNVEPLPERKSFPDLFGN